MREGSASLTRAGRHEFARHESWYKRAGTDETIVVGADGRPALHLIDYTDSNGEQILRLVNDRTVLGASIVSAAELGAVVSLR